MRASPVDLIGGYYKSDTLPWACQETVNWLPVLAEVEGTLSPAMLKTPPGLRPYQQIGTGPIRGMHDCEGIQLIVSGSYLYRITTAGVGVPIGVIPGVSRVSITHNQFQTGFQVLVENGQPGGGYVYNTVDQTFARITDDGYPGSISSDYLDSFLLGVEPFGRFWFHSDLSNATSYNTLDRYEAEASPDRIVGLAVSGDEVVVFGQTTTEFFYNVGTATGTFQNRRQTLKRGCASRDSIAKLDNTVFWLGDDGIVYRLAGYGAQPVSTRALDQVLSSYNLSQAFAFTWEDRGHKVYYLTFPDGQTFGFDVITNLWHRRESFGLKRWRLTHAVQWSGKWYGGDFQTGRVFRIDWDYHLEGSQEIISERVSPQLSDNQSLLGIPNAELVFDTGQGPGTEPVDFPIQPEGPSIAGNAPTANLGDAYSYAYSITAGDKPIVSVRIGSGSLPDGMTLSTDGVISGTGTRYEQASFSIIVTDANGLWVELSDTLQVAPVWLATGSGLPGNQYAYGIDNGRNWNHAARTAQVGASKQYRLAMTSGSRIALITATGGSGVYSADGGNTFVEASGLSLQTSSAGLFDGSAFIIVKNSRVINYSTTGISYQTVTVANTNGSDGTGNFTCVCTNGQRVVACASRSTVSLDHGVTWSALGTNYVFPAVSTSAGGPTANGVATNGAIFVAVGAGNNVSWSENGTTWTSVASPFGGTVALTAVAYAAGHWTICNSDGRIAYGPNLGAMTISPFLFGASITAINSFLGTTVIGGTLGRMAYSEDGVNWQFITTPLGTSITYQSIAVPPEMT